MTNNLANNLINAQRSEISDYFIYKILSGFYKEEKNDILKNIYADERSHYKILHRITGTKVKPSRIKIFIYILISKILGLTFAIKLMERGEVFTQDQYNSLCQKYPQIKKLLDDEINHEKQLIGLINEERLLYVSSIVLGLSDALVELTGALAGLTLALQNPKLIAMVGLITGIAASMSMAASEYLATKEEGNSKHPFKASIYTGCTYIFTVIMLITPYFILNNVILSFCGVISIALLIIFLFTFYNSVVRDLNLRKQFIEMTSISLSIAFLNFGIGLIVRKIFGIDV